MAEYFHGLFELHRREPSDDLTTHLVQAEENGNKLTNEGAQPMLSYCWAPAANHGSAMDFWRSTAILISSGC
jgi:predicted RecA/RadA family phage recombinase